jgi:hypothetical protein
LCRAHHAKVTAAQARARAELRRVARENNPLDTKKPVKKTAKKPMKKQKRKRKLDK